VLNQASKHELIVSKASEAVINMLVVLNEPTVRETRGSPHLHSLTARIGF
jgi:hypothetical protein